MAAVLNLPLIGRIAEHALAHPGEGVWPFPLERACGPCRACCRVMGVPEVPKAPYEPCPHRCPAGCGLHGTPAKPKSCVEYACLWLAGVVGGGDDGRPDRSGLVINFGTWEGVGVHFVAWETCPGAAKGLVASRLLRRLAQTHVVALRHYGEPDRASLLGPPALQARFRACNGDSLSPPTRGVSP